MEVPENNAQKIPAAKDVISTSIRQLYDVIDFEITFFVHDDDLDWDGSNKIGTLETNISIQQICRAYKTTSFHNILYQSLG